MALKCHLKYSIGNEPLSGPMMVLSIDACIRQAAQMSYLISPPPTPTRTKWPPFRRQYIQTHLI